jgi:hypothetical protein
MTKPEVEKKANIDNLTSELCWRNSYRQSPLKNYHTITADKCLKMCKVTKKLTVLTAENYRKAI